MRHPARLSVSDIQRPTSWADPVSCLRAYVQTSRLSLVQYICAYPVLSRSLPVESDESEDDPQRVSKSGQYKSIPWLTLEREGAAAIASAAAPNSKHNKPSSSSSAEPDSALPAPIDLRLHHYRALLVALLEAGVYQHPASVRGPLLSALHADYTKPVTEQVIAALDSEYDFDAVADGGSALDSKPALVALVLSAGDQLQAPTHWGLQSVPKLVPLLLATPNGSDLKQPLVAPYLVSAVPLVLSALLPFPLLPCHPPEVDAVACSLMVLFAERVTCSAVH
jgi:hypothetical protein